MTVTLPEDVIARLMAIDVDLGQAIVAIVEHQRRQPPRGMRPAELASYGHHAVIVVPPVNALKHIEGVELVPIGGNRALISLAHPHSIPQLELDLREALEHDEMRQLERPTCEAVADILRQARLSGDFTVEERTIIVLKSRRQRRP